MAILLKVREARVAVPAIAAAMALALCGAAGLWAGQASAEPSAAPSGAPSLASAAQLGLPEVTTLRLYGDSVICDSCILGQSNRPASAGADGVVDPNTGLVPEDAPYTDPRGPFSPLSGQAPRHDYVTWDPAWISERLGDPDLQQDWDCANGLDEVSAASNIRAGGVNAAEKVWLRHWYEPTHLDKDLNADDCLTDDNGDGIPDAAPNPAPSNDDEWYPAIMTELTYLLTENELPIADPQGDEVDDQAPRPACGAAGGTRWVFPAGTFAEATDENGPLEGQGLTSLDVDFDGRVDMINVTSERELANDLGLTIDFDGDGVVDDLDPAGPLSCDAMVVMHTDATMIDGDGMLQFLDHYVRLVAANDNSATLEIWYNGDLLPRLVDSLSVGVGSAVLASDVGPIPPQDRIGPGGDNLGTVPRGAWFAYLDATDSGDDTATVIVGRALGAPCASMEAAPNVANLSPGGPWHLKRFYVDGHEYNVTAIQTCSPTELQYLTLRAPLPKVPATIEQHSVRLQPYGELDNLVLPPPFNHEHTILEDIVVVAEEEIGPCPVFDPLANPFDPEPRPNIHYMGGPIGPVPPVLSGADGNRYTGRDPNAPVGPYQGADFFFASRWFYVDEDVNPQMLGQLREKYGAGFVDIRDLGSLDLVFADFFFPNAPDRICQADGMGGFTCVDDTGTVGGSGGVATGDFNGDGNADAVFARGGFFAVPATNLICLGDGAGNFACSDVSADVNDSERVAVGDVNDDGDLDAVFANIGGVNRVCLGDGAGGFACSDVSADANDSADVALAFVDGDGNLDAVFANAVGPNRLCLGDGAGGFTCSDVSADAFISDEVALGDLDGDGNTDAVFANILSANRVCLGDGLGGFACSDVEALSRPTWGVALGDFDGDLVLDVIFANNGAADERLCFGNGDGTFTCGPDLDGGDGTSGVAVADLEADGDIDLVFSTINAPDRACYNEGAGTFACFDIAGMNNSNDVAIASFYNPELPEDPFFFNEQMWTRPWNYTEFYLPDHTLFDECEADAYSVTTGFTNPTARWRLWSQPDDDVPDEVPPPPPDLVLDNTGYDPMTGQYGAPRRAGFVYDPDRMDPIYTSDSGVRLHGGWPRCPDGDCDGDDARPDVHFGAGDVLATDVAGLPVEVPPYTDPFAPFNPQAPDAPRGDLLTFNPAYMDEFRNFGEPLRLLYQQLSNGSMNAREKVYQRAWYQPEYTTKIRDFDDCDTDLSFPAVMQEFTYLMMDTTDNPLAVPVPGSRLGFPVATGADELPRPNLGGTLPTTGTFGYGLTSFDVDFDGFPEAVGLHTELSANDYFSATFAANRPAPPIGFPQLPLPGALVDFDGDGIVTDTLDADCVSLNGNEMVVFTAESIVLDAEEGDPAFGHAAQFLDYLVVAENVVGGSNSRAQLRFYFAGGTVHSAVPEQVGGTRTLGVGSVAVVDRFQDRVRVIDPGESNAGLVDGAWFVFVEDVSADGERVTLTLGRALGATHSAIDDGNGFHDLTPGDPWYLKRFYVDGHEYSVTALMTRSGLGNDPIDPATCNDRFAFITIRTPVPKGNYFNPQDSLFQQGYFLDGLPPKMSVMPPFNTDHTIVEDVERIEADEFANLNFYDACVGALAPAGPQMQQIVAEEPEPRFAQELRETYRPSEGSSSPAPRLEDGWETHQLAVTPGDFTEIGLPEGQRYLLTLNWRSEVSRLAFYGCTRDAPGPFDDENEPPELGHDDVAMAAMGWDPLLVPAVNRFDPPLRDEDDNGIQDIAPFFDARCSVTETVRVKLFYDPTEDDDLYVNKRPVDLPYLDIDAAIEKTASTNSPAAGSELVYTVEVTNNGPDDAPGAIVVDELPDGVTYLGDTDSCVPAGSDPEVLTCTLGPIPNGGSDSFQITVRLDDNVPAGQPLVNVATVTIPAALDNDPTNDTDDATVIPVHEADLRAEKSAPSGSAVAGEPLTYTIEATNDGPSFATGVLLTDTLPDEVSFVTTSRNDLCSFFGPDLVVCAVGDLAVGDSIAIDVTVDVPADVPPGTLLENVVVVDGERDDPDPANNEDDADVIAVAEADLSLTKEASPDPVVAGERLTYTLTVDNAGPSDSPSVQVVDTLPAEVEYVGAIGAACVGVPVGGTGVLTCQLGAIPAGGNAAFEIVVDVRADTPVGTTIDNTAVASDPGATDPDPSNNDDDAQVTVETEADLRLGKDGPDEVFPGTEFDWTLTVTNGGPSDAQNVVITDTLPVSTTFVSASGASCGGVAMGGTGTLVCDVGPLAAGASAMVDVRLRVDDGAADLQVLTNNATTGSDTPDPDSGNDDAQDTTTVRRQADLALDKSAIGAAVAGDILVYTLDIDNAGPSTAVDVVVTDTLPTGASFVSSDPACVENPPASGQLSCDLPDLASGGMEGVTITVTLDAALPDGSSLTNRAGVTASTPDPDPSDNTDEVTSIVARQVNLTIALADLPDPVTAGSSLRYTVTVENEGPSDATNVIVVDTLPAGTTFDTSDAGCVQAPVGTLTCGLGGLASGASTSFTIDVTVDPGVPGGTILVDQATVSADETEINLGDNSDSESTLVVAEADLAITKAAGSATVVAGTQLNYTVVVTNSGPSDAPNVVVVDTLPAGTSFVSSTGGCVEAPAGILTCALGDLAAGASTSFNVTVDVDADVPEATVLANLVTVDSEADDPNLGDNSDTADVTVLTEADLSIDKAGPAMVEPGMQLAYGLTVTNNGPSDAVNVVVTDTLPLSTTYVNAIGASCAEGPSGTVVCDLGAMAAMAMQAFNLLVTVDADAPEGLQLQNLAEVGSDTDDPVPGNNIDDAVTTVDPRFEADLRLTKEALETMPGAGEFFSYRITVVNGGPREATNVLVTDTLPVGVSYEFDSDSCVEGPVGTLVCSLGDLVSGGSASFTITVRVDGSVPAGTVLTNTATTTSDLPDPDPGNNTDTADVTVVPRVDLRVTIDDTVDPVAAGDLLGYVLLVENLGPSDATGVVVTHTLPAGVGYVSDDGGCDTSGLPELVCTVGALASGADTTINVVVSVPANTPDGTVLLSDASVAGNETDPVLANNEDDESTTVVRQSDLQILKSASHDTRAPGELLTYTLDVENLGPGDATGVVLTDTLPAGTSYESDDGGCDASGEPVIVCALGNLAAGASTAIQIVVRLDLATQPDAQLENRAEVEGDQPDPDPGNDEDTVITTVTPLADLRVDKEGVGEVLTGPTVEDVTVTPGVVTAGRRVTYTLTIGNGGPTAASDVVLTDTLPAGVTYVSDDAGCDTFGLPVLRCAIGGLASGASTMVTVVVDTDPGLAPFSMLENLVVVGGDDPDPDPSNNEDDHNTTVLVSADLSILKRADPVLVTPGGTVTFGISVTNAGPSLARDVVVGDTLPMSVTYVSDSGGCDTAGLPTLSCALGDMAPGASVSFDVTATVEVGLEGQTVSNTATVQLTGGGSDPDPGNNSSTTTFDVEQEADLRITKTGVGEVVLPGSPPGLSVTADMVSAGQRLTYTLYVTNTGPAAASSVVVTDTLPPGVSYLSDDVGCDASGAPEIVCALGALPAGGSASITLLVDVDPAVADGSALANGAIVDGGLPDPNPGDNSTMQTTLVSAYVDLMVVKTADPSALSVGELVTFSLTVANAGPAEAAGAVVTDTLPPDFSYVSDDAGCDTGGLPEIVCALGDLPPGAMSKVEIVAQAGAGAAGQSRTNVARVGLEGGGSDADPSNDEDEAEVDVRALVDLSVSKAGAGAVVVPGSPPGLAVLPNAVTAGERLTYTLDVANAGPSTATGVVLTDTLPAGTSYVSASGASCSTVGLPTLSCTLPSLGPGGMLSVIVVVEVDPDVADGTMLRNTTGVTANESESDPSDNSDAQDTDVGASADLRLLKSADPSTQLPGGLVTYTLSVDNLGPSDAVGVVLTDTLPTDVSYVSDDAGCDTSGLPQITCALGGLAAGGSAMVVITVQVGLAAQAGAVLTNVATVGSGTPDPDPSNDEDSVSVTVRVVEPDEADLAIDKTGEGEVLSTGPTVTVTPGEVSAGRRLTWTLSVSNAGPATATGVTVTDTLPAGTSFVSASVGCDASGLPELVCSLPDLASGANTSFTVVADVDAAVADGSLLDNVAVVGGAAPDGNPDDNSATQRTLVRAAADLTVTKTADPNQVEPGGFTTFTLQATNLGPSVADEVRLIDTLPAGLAYVSDDAGCDTAALPTLSCDLGDLAPGASATVQVVAEAVGAPDTSWTNTVTVALTGDGNDPDLTNNSDSDDVDILMEVAPVDLSLEKSGAGEFVTTSSPPGLAIVPGLVSAGRRLTYTLTVRNVGVTPATGVTVSDTLPAGVSFVSSSEPCDTTGAPVISCDAPDLGPGAMATVVVSVDVSPDVPHFGVLTNVARVDADMPDNNPSDNTADQDTVVFAVADLALEKTAEPSVVPEGGSVTFVLTATNLGPSLARGVELADTVPAGLTYTGDDGDCDTGSLPVITCNLGDLAPGASAEVRITATADGGAGGQTLTNAAVVSLTGEGSDPDPSNNDASADVGVEASASVDLALSKSGQGEVVTDGSPPGVSLVADQVSAGRRMTYTLDVENTGLLGATNVVLSDTLPVSVTYVSDTGGCDTSGLPVLDCALGALAAGASTSFEVVVDVAADTPEGAQILNPAEVEADEPEADTTNNGDTHTTDVDARSDLALTKRASRRFVTTGDSVTFEIEVTNGGPSLARDVRVTDTLPAGSIYVSDTDSCVQGPVGTLVCELGDILSGASTAFEIVTTVGGGLFGSTLTNTATAGLPGGGSDPDPSNDMDSATVRVVDPGDAADLTIKKSITETLPSVGELFTYTVQVVNNGPALAPDTTVSDTLTSTDLGAVRLITTTLGGACAVLDDHHVECDLGDIPSGGVVDYKVTGQLLDVPDMGEPALYFTNTVTVESSAPDLDPSNNTGFAWVEVLPSGFMMTALPFSGSQASLLWEDAAVGEVDFLVEGRAGRAPFAPVAVIPSPDPVGVGRAVQWLSEPLPAGRDYVFRVIARDAAGGTLASAGRSLRIPARPRAETACADGRIALPGRGRHEAWLAVDGIPLASASASGAFQLCGLPPGGRVLSAFRDGWLQAETRLTLAAGGTRELPRILLPAGDHDRDGRIDVADLARVSARVGLEPVDPRADLDGDGRVGPGDLEVLSDWLGAVAPAPW